MKVPGWIWLIWGSVGVLLEGIAIGTRERGDTLTETLIATLPWFLVLLAAIWVTWHFGIRVWRGRGWSRTEDE